MYFLFNMVFAVNTYWFINYLLCIGKQIEFVTMNCILSMIQPNFNPHLIAAGIGTRLEHFTLNIGNYIKRP
jgi:hypothetical protein